jgi:endonuclease/exonuclease/phosphatase family metal-dependent hydrolase
MLRIATFNIENLDNQGDDKNPPLAERVSVLQNALRRLDADILCLQEVHGQELPEHNSSHPRRDLAALDTVLHNTRYEHYERAFTLTTDQAPYDKRNLVILSRSPIIAWYQYRNDKIGELQYRKVTARPEESEARDLGWERPILHAIIEHPQLGPLHVINLHLKSRLASNVSGQKLNLYLGQCQRLGGRLFPVFHQTCRPGTGNPHPDRRYF